MLSPGLKSNGFPLLRTASEFSLNNNKNVARLPSAIASSVQPSKKNSILLNRELIELNKVTNPKNKIAISSYNILSRHYLWESIYSYLPHDDINWKNRFQRLNKNFDDLSQLSDVMCFQEMEYQVYENYWKKFFLDKNFDSIFVKKPKPNYWKKSSNMMDGVSIFFNRALFELVNYEKIDFSHHFKNSNVFEQTFDVKERLNIRNTVALIAVLKHKLTNEVLFISNTHLYWSPKHDDVKLMQTYLLADLIKKSIMRYYKCSIQEVDEMIKSNDKLNIIMVGDFNSTPDSMVYKFMSTGTVSKEFVQNYGKQFSSSINNSLGLFRSPYHDLYVDHKFTKTTYTNKFKDIIDYIWFNNSNKNLKFTKVLGEVNHDYLSKFKGFPNEQFPSDHLPILAQFEIVR